MEEIDINQIVNACSLIGNSFSRNSFYIILNFVFWFIGFIVFYRAFMKSKKARSKKLKTVFLQMKKSEWIYFFVFAVLTLFILVIEAILYEIPKESLTEKVIHIRSMVYLLFSLFIPQISRITTYVKFIKTI